MVVPASGQWRVASDSDSHQNLPDNFPSGGNEIKVGDKLPPDQRFRWLAADIEIPEIIDGQHTAGKTVGMQVSGGDGGEVYVAGQLQGRYDNDHPLVVILTDKATPRQKVPVAVQVFGVVQGGGKFDEAKMVIISSDRIEPVKLSVDVSSKMGHVPNGLIGLSQGGGLSDYEDATAAKLKEGGFKWLRTDNVLTQALKKDADGKFVYDWSEFDKRVDFIYKIGADPIFAASYMPQVLDAVPNNDRQSAPNDYDAWEELCYQAAKHSRERGKPVTYWEVWNEANSGWIKPGPNDTGSEEFKKLYHEALGKDEPDHEIVRRFEAYAKLYRATVRGVLGGDSNNQGGRTGISQRPIRKQRIWAVHPRQRICPRTDAVVPAGKASVGLRELARILSTCGHDRQGGRCVPRLSCGFPTPRESVKSFMISY